ncbi:MAG: TerB N-terminal domain-containing protein [Synergistaceae bacterium]|nr:TerB N-terminal domain-containing protein [Synergistaceae bacterium]
MIYLVIGIVVVVVASAFLSQRARNAADTDEEQGIETAAQEGSVETSGFEEALRKAETESSSADSLSLSRAGPGAETVPSVPAAPEAEDPGWGAADEVTPLRPVLAAAPISSPSALSSATYSSAAPHALAGESPYAFGNTPEEKPKPDSSLLRWSGKMGSIQVGEFSIRGPVAYWSEGISSTPEPSCIDITLPVEYPGEEREPPSEGAVSYAEMSPAQRGVYLLWLAGGRIQSPIHVCYPTLWLFGLERRVLSDRLDAVICIGEAFRLIPLSRWASLKESLIRFVTWTAAKVWLPEEQLLAFSRSLLAVPKEILCMLLRPYADAGLPLPSLIAFTVMRAAPFETEGAAKGPIPHSDELLEKFASVYKSKCSGGVVLTRPKSALFVAYVPSNPSLSNDKNASGGVLELPDFFRDAKDFVPLIAAWNAFLPSIQPSAQLTAAEEVKERPDWDVFVRGALGLPEGNGELIDVRLLKPIFTNLGVLGDLMGIERPPEEQGDENAAKNVKNAKKTKAADRKKIVDAAKVEGFLVLPDLGITGKEYLWDAPVVLTPFPAGARLSQDCSAAALLFEYAAALTALFVPEALEGMIKCLGDYFSLSSDDGARLEALSSVLASLPEGPDRGPENIGECLQFWLNREERGVVRDFMRSFLANFARFANLSVSSGEDRETQEWDEKVCESLGVEESDPPPVSFGGEKPLLELGLTAGKVLAPLFKD